MNRLIVRTLANMASGTDKGVATALKDVIKRIDTVLHRANIQRQVSAIQ